MFRFLFHLVVFIIRRVLSSVNRNLHVWAYFLLVIVVNQTDIVLLDVIEGLREKMS